MEIELYKSSVLMVLYAVYGFDRNLSRFFGFGLFLERFFGFL